MAPNTRINIYRIEISDVPVVYSITCMKFPAHDLEVIGSNLTQARFSVYSSESDVNKKDIVPVMLAGDFNLNQSM